MAICAVRPLLFLFFYLKNLYLGGKNVLIRQRMDSIIIMRDAAVK